MKNELETYFVAAVRSPLPSASEIELTSPLPIIEPTYLMALILGFVFCFQWEGWLHRLFPNLKNDQIALRIIFDAILLFVFFVALASSASATYRPGIYGGF